MPRAPLGQAAAGRVRHGSRALGVQCGDLPLPFFPDLYNEDWFFFGEAAAHRRLAKVGEARQAVYDPYAEPTRASDEEFGDLLAEGLYSLIENIYPLIDNWRPSECLSNLKAIATAKFWSSYINVRVASLRETLLLLDEMKRRSSDSADVTAAIKSLEVAVALYRDGVISWTKWCPSVPRRLAARYRYVEQGVRAY